MKVTIFGCTAVRVSRVTIVVAALVCLGPTVWEGRSAVVATPTEAALRAAMAGGGTVHFGCDGTIILKLPITVSKDTLLDGAGHQIALSGGNAVRIFVVATNTTLTLVNLGLANGLSTNGGGIYNAGGTLNVTNCVFALNVAVGSNGINSFDPNGKQGRGGAVYNVGRLVASGCTFWTNAAQGGNGIDAALESRVQGLGGAGEGGAIYNAGEMSAAFCTFQGNLVCGGAGGMSDLWPSYLGGRGGEASGAAVCSPGKLTIGNSAFWENVASSGRGGNGRHSPNQGWGPFWWNDGGVGGNGGAAFGALSVGSPSSLINCTVACNRALGGAGGNGGNGGSYFEMGQGIYIIGAGGPGGFGGDAQAAIYDPKGVLQLMNCTVALNVATNGSGGVSGENGNHSGGGVRSKAGVARGSLLGTNTVILNTILADNSPGNCSGALVDIGHNISSDGSAGFTHATSFNNVDPALGELADNGGPTLTMMPLPDSPAIDAADSASAPMMDQRGFPRPAGAAPDAGALEYGSIVPTVTITRPIGTILEIVGRGNTNQACRLLVSTDLVNWSLFATNQIGNDGTVRFGDNCGTAGPMFYRLAMP